MTKPFAVYTMEAKRKFRMWSEAEDAASQGKSYAIDGLSLTRQDMTTIRAQITYWAGRVRALQGRKTSPFKQGLAPGMGYRGDR